ncbi:MAG: glycoside hydrolase family 78 protein [Candidatus Hodarchaeales archaeon]
MDISNLRCEYLDNPIGIDVLKPRLSWKLKTKRRSARQQAYQIHCATIRNFDTDRIIWDSGKTISDQSIHVEYGSYYSQVVKMLTLGFFDASINRIAA